MRTLDKALIKWPCGCVGLDIIRGDDASFVLAPCNEHSRNGSAHAHWRHMNEYTKYALDVGMSLAVLNGVIGLIRDGWKLRELKRLLSDE
jgi:hypothetical protein